MIVVAHAHELGAPIERDPVVRVSAAPSAHMLRPERVPELVQHRIIRICMVASRPGRPAGRPVDSQGSVAVQ
jgi:hypothetical protein